MDEAAKQGWARPCDSMKDGPFCHGLPKMASNARHRPFTVDSIVPQNLFGDPRVAMELNSASDVTDVDAAVSKQATATLNHFLEEYYNSKAQPGGTVAPVEGQLALSSLGLLGDALGGLPTAFSLGLPAGVVATWDGAWQATTARSPPPDAVLGGSRSRQSAVRLNGAAGVIRFSRPVVVRHLLVRPPLHVARGRHRLLVRAWKAESEAWRADYEFEAAVGPQAAPACEVGDTVIGKWAGDGRKFLAAILTAHKDGATLWWSDNDHTHRLVPWRHIVKPDGTPCGPHRKANGADKAGLWRDLARRLKSVDELWFTAPEGEEGWLLSELEVAVTSRDQEVQESGDKAAARLHDFGVFNVQVLPGPHAAIVEMSRAAVTYHADDMLERGLALLGQQEKGPPSAEAEMQQGSSGQIILSNVRSVEGLRQLLWALASNSATGPKMKLPPHVQHKWLLEELHRLVQALDVEKSKSGVERTMKKFGHFEVFFAFQWDWLVKCEALQVAFERWRRDPQINGRWQGVLAPGQLWHGSYFCTQGWTALNLEVTQVLQEGDEDLIHADLSFVIQVGKGIHGRYQVIGRLEKLGGSLVFEPVPNSWKNQPQNFVMVGLQGVVSLIPRPDGVPQYRFAGSVPIFGCDSFELITAVKEDLVLESESTEAEGAVAEVQEATPVETGVRVPQSLWQTAIARLAQGLDENRRRWRGHLQRIISEKSPEGQDGQQNGQVVQLIQAARDAGVLSFQMTTDSGQEITIRLQPQPPR